MQRTLDWKKILLAGSALVAIVAVVVAISSMFSGTNQQTGTAEGTFGTSGAVSGGAAVMTGGERVLPAFATDHASGAPVSPVFAITDGPVIAAILVEAGTPTTTTARYITASDGHVSDLPLDVAGAAARAVSNTTVPGVERALWTYRGRGVILQYLSGGTVKSVHIAFGASASQSTLRFLPDEVYDIAVSPDGTRIAFALENGTSGSIIYTASPDGGGASALATTPLRHIVLSWPSAKTLLFYSASEGGVPGMAFSVDAVKGMITPLLLGAGLTASADSSFANILYRLDANTGSTVAVEDTKTQNGGRIAEGSAALDSLIPETCVWSFSTTTRAYCAAPLAGGGTDYIDRWHRGQASRASALVSVNPTTAAATPIATPGSQDGGKASDMVFLSLSPDERYLSFIAKNNGSLWGIRIR